MFSKLISTSAIGLTLLLSTGASLAAPILWDYSPVTTGGTVRSDNWTNILPGQHFAEKVTFSSTTLVGGMDIYSDSAFGKLHDEVRITIWSSAGGEPGSVAAAFTTVVSAVDSDGAYAGQHRLHAAFSGFSMLADTVYWIGMAPTSASWTQTGLNSIAGGNNRSAQFHNGSFLAETFVGDMAFRLLAPAAAQVPEPGAPALLIVAFIAAAAARRRRT